MAKSRASSEGKKFLIVLVMLAVVATPIGQHAYMGVASFFSKKIAGAIMHSIPNLPGVTPSPSPKATK